MPKLNKYIKAFTGLTLLLSRWAKVTSCGAIPGEGIEPIAKDEALAYAKYAGLSLDKFARAGFEQVEDY